MYWLHSLAQEGGTDKDGDRIYWGSTQWLTNLSKTSQSQLDINASEVGMTDGIFEDVNIEILWVDLS